MFSFFKRKKPEISEELKDAMNLIMLRAFPGGDKQRENETSNLLTALQGKLTRKETGSLLSWTKILLVTSEDLSLTRISDGTYRHEEGRLSRLDSEFVYRQITGIKEDLFTGGSGLYQDDPVIINCSITVVGKWAEKK
jgi:hypothetical protein